MPLDTLAGWPVAPPVSPVELLTLLVGVPALVIIIVFAIAQVAYRNIWQPGPATGNAVSIGTGPADPLDGNPTPAQLERDGEPVEGGGTTGGASARW